MIIQTLAPARISLYGGSTDVSPYCDIYGGEVISFAINIYSHVTLYSDDEMWQMTKHEMPYNADPELFYSILDHYGLNGMHHVRIKSTFDGVLGAGLASSGSATIALLTALYKFKSMPIKDRLALAHQGWDLEKRFHHTGKQDHYAAAFGGMNNIQFTNHHVGVSPYTRTVAEALRERIYLFYVGGKRVDKDGQAVLTELTPQRLAHLEEMRSITRLADKAIRKEDWATVGELLDATWQEKKAVNPKITTGPVNDLYDYAQKHGAIGGKLCGSGQAGYMIFLVEPDNKSNFLARMADKNAYPIDYSICYNGAMGRIV